MFRKQSAIEKRRKKVERELSRLQNDIKTLSRVVDDPEHVDVSPLDLDNDMRVVRKAVMPADSKGVLKKEQHETSESVKKNPHYGHLRHEERIAEYLTGNFQTVSSLRNERKLQRNKAIVMVIVVLLFLVWLLSRFFS